MEGQRDAILGSVIRSRSVWSFVKAITVSSSDPSRKLRVDAELIKSFAAGELSPVVEDKIAAYLDQRPKLVEQGAALSGENFLAKLRDVRQRSLPPVNSAPSSLGSGTRQEFRQPGTASDSKKLPNVTGVPKELANYPAYKIIKELGRGGMGVVYLAKNIQMDRLEVLKVLNERLLDHAGAKERFLREVRAVSKLNHANIVTSYSILPLQSQLVFVMEFVNGTDLHHYIQARHPLPVGQACSFAQQIAAGLQHAYERGLVHRDIKPANVIVYRSDGRMQLKILDFGLAKASSEKTTGGLTQDGTMLGTPEYMSPEQTLNAAKADIRADIYSLGCTLYCMLTGNPPFRGTHGEVLMAHAQRDPQPVNLVRPDVSPELAAVIGKMMAKTADKRYQTPSDVIAALKPFIDESSLAERRGGEPQVAAGTVHDLAASDRETSVEEAVSSFALDTSSQLVDSQSQLAAIANLMGDQRRGVSQIVRRQQRRRAKPKKRRPSWFVPVSIAGVLLFFFGGLWAGGVFRLKTSEGTIVVEQVPEDADILVDGKRIEINWNQGKDHAEIQIAPGSHLLEVLSRGIRVYGQNVEIAEGESNSVKIALESPAAVPHDPDVQGIPRPTPTPAEPSISVERTTISAPPETDSNFVSLWNGKDFEGWSFDSRSAGGWRVENDYIVGSGQTSILTTDRDDYEHFDLKLEVAMCDLANGDIQFGGSDKQLRCCSLKLEQIGQIGLRNLDKGNMGVHAPHRRVSINDSEWFQLRIVQTANRLAIYVNSELLNEQTRVGLDKPNAIMLRKLRKQGEVKFRNLRISEIESKETAKDHQPHEVLFNGRDLTGWKGSPSHWSVTDGCLTGITTSETPLDANTCLAWQGGEFEDFELEFEYKISGGGNSGLQYRSHFIDPAQFIMSGYQADIDGSLKYSGSVYEEKGRGMLAERGQRVTIDSSGAKKVEDLGDSAQLVSALKPNDWNHCRVVAIGNRLSHYYNSQLMSEVVDDEATKSSRTGLIGFQLHRGEPMQVQFRDVRLKRLPVASISETTNDVSQTLSAEPIVPASIDSSQVSRLAMVQGRGDWIVENGELVQRNVNPPGSIISFGDPSWSRYELSLLAMSTQGPHGFKIIFHKQETTTHVEYALGNYHNDVHSVEFASQEKSYADHRQLKKLNDSTKIRFQEWYSVRLRVDGSQFYCYLNGELLFEGNNEDFGSRYDFLMASELGVTSARFKRFDKYEGEWIWTDGCNVERFPDDRVSKDFKHKFLRLFGRLGNKTGQSKTLNRIAKPLTPYPSPRVQGEGSMFS